MGKFLRTLSKIGLVELDEPEEEPAAPAARAGARPAADDIDMAELDRLIKEAADEEPAPAPAPRQQAAPPRQQAAPARAATVQAAPAAAPVAAAAGPAGSAAIREGCSFDQIYSSSSLPPSPFPAEKMLRVLDGLRAMDAGTRKAAVMAMDAADDAWSVDDSVLDAERKIRALQSAGAALVERVNQEAARAASELQARDTYQQQATESIRKQIAELELMLQQELQKVSEEKAAIETGLQSARQACDREIARYQQEIARLQEIPAIFGTPGPTAR